ncbi:MAG: GNAT family N-acetyltransferase [Agriterribacter sp.]
MNFQSVIPILYSSDVNASIRYFVEVLGFTGSWTWDEAPSFGGVDKGHVRLFFCKDGQGQPGTWLAINVDDIEAYYEFIKSRGAKILSDPQTYDWGLREMLVETPDGHKIRFGQGVSVRHENGDGDAAAVQLVQRLPTPQELHSLTVAVGWSKAEEPAPTEIPTPAIVHTVVAEEAATGNAIGCAFLLSDHSGFYYVKNVIVHPAWQNRHIGTDMMQHLDDWLENNATPNASVYLHTGEYLAPFYNQFGFAPAFSMYKKVKGKNAE